MKEKINSAQLHSNIMFILDEAGLTQRNSAEDLAATVGFLKVCLSASHPDTKMFYIEDDGTTQENMKISDMAIGEDGLPVITAEFRPMEHFGLNERYIRFSWQTKDGRNVSAAFPNIAFYL